MGSRRLRLENLFVPLHLDVEGGGEKKERKSVGEVLAGHPRVALLAAPGGGKSTLMKRLAVAYADPARRGQVDDNLPARDWLPLFFRCRELRDLARGSFSELLDALAQREGVRPFAAVFRSHVDRALLAGGVLLLVDGLDEIADAGDRAALVCTVRTALQAYPGTALVVTSRDAGFRQVAAHLASVCTRATLSPLDDEDIRRLSVAWHSEVAGASEKVRADAEQLAAAISGNDRVRSLAVNPLLLTTLLLVKRWVGSLPTRRAVLYGKAVEVLHMTWNVEGHDPIPEEEALPQLCYVASSMMLEGVRRISRPRLAALLQEARAALPTELAWVKGSVEEFVRRVEDRSSLLMMTGHDVEDGRLVEFFEFRHLTFQEFLTARAIVEGWHPGRRQEDTLVTVLEPHFAEEEWREVIPLAAVLGGRQTDELIRRLTERLGAIARRKFEHIRVLDVRAALGRCLADEAPASPETVRGALKTLLDVGFGHSVWQVGPMLARGRYGAGFREEAGKAFLAHRPDLLNAAASLLNAVFFGTSGTEEPAGYGRAAERFLELLRAPETLDRCEGALGLELLCDQLQDPDLQPGPALTSTLRASGPALGAMLFEEEPAAQFAASRALGALGSLRVWPPPAEPDILGRLFTLWRGAADPEVRDYALWALASQPIASREDGKRGASISGTHLECLFEEYGPRSNDPDKQLARLVITWYRRAPLGDDDIRRHAVELSGRFQHDDPARRTLGELLAHLGPEK